MLLHLSAPSYIKIVNSSQGILMGCILFFFEVFEEPEDPNNRSFFSEIISSISDVKFSHSGRYMMTRDYLSVKIWDLNMETRPVETYQVCNCCHTKIKIMSVFVSAVHKSDIILLFLHKREVFEATIKTSRSPVFTHAQLVIVTSTPLHHFSLNRCTNISGVSCVHSMRMIASSTSLSAVGMGMTGEHLFLFFFLLICPVIVTVCPQENSCNSFSAVMFGFFIMSCNSPHIQQA